MTNSRRPVPSQRMRPRPQPPSVHAGSTSPSGEPERWVGLREAEELTGIPSSTIRNWARKRRIESRFELDESGDRRYVEINEVVAWADHLGRQHKRVASTESRVASEEDVASTESRAANEEHIAGTESRAADEEDVAGTGSGVASQRAAGTRDQKPATRDASSPDETEIRQATSEVPEGTMLVPLDAWNKMLMQLGNLHEAGQQLAEARERAARAETEVQFLRERLAEMRERANRASHPAPDGPAQETPSIPSDDEPLWVDLYHRWKRRRR